MMRITDDIKQYIEENKQLIEENKWDEFYRELSIPNFRLLGSEVKTLTAMFNEAGIDPLRYLNYIPNYYFFTNPLHFKSYVIPLNIEKLCEGAFEKCIGLKEITLPKSLEKIDWKAFLDSKELETVNIEKLSCRLPTRTFEGCNNLSTIIFDGTEADFFSIDTDWYDIVNKAGIKQLEVKCITRTFVINKKEV